MEFLFIALMEKTSPFIILLAFNTSPLLQEGSIRNTSKFPIKKLHTLRFLQNWAVKNPAGTRLDSSSLVNKQVGLVASSLRG